MEWDLAMDKQWEQTHKSLQNAIETLKAKINEFQVPSCMKSCTNEPQHTIFQVVEEAEAFLRLCCVASTSVSNESHLQLITLLSNILSNVLELWINSTSCCFLSVDSNSHSGSVLGTSLCTVDNQDKYFFTENETSQVVFQDSKFSESNNVKFQWGCCHLEQFYFWSSCSYQALLHYDKLSIDYCKDEDILHVMNTIYEMNKDTLLFSIQSCKVNIQEIQSHFYQTIQQSICEWDLTNILIQSVAYVHQGNCVSYLIESLCFYIMEHEGLNIYGWRLIGSFMVMMEVLLSKIDKPKLLERNNDFNYCNRWSALYVQNMLLRLFGCPECSARRCKMPEMLQGILMSITQIYKLQHYSEAVLSLYLDLFYIFSSPQWTISYRNELEQVFQWMSEMTGGDWIQEINQQSDVHDEPLLSETVLFILRWLPYSFISKIGYHNSSIPHNIYRSPHRLDWLLLALERKYQQETLIFSSNPTETSHWIQQMLGYLLSIYAFEQSTNVCYEKIIGKHIWKWLRLSVDSFPLWQSSLVLLAVVGRTWLLMLYFFSSKNEFQYRHLWILTDRLVSLLQIEQLSRPQKTILAYTIIFMWPSFILSKSCQSLANLRFESDLDTLSLQEKNIISRFFQWYEESSLSPPSSWLPMIHFWIQHYKASR